jgi:hypothetical protein
VFDMRRHVRVECSFCERSRTKNAQIFFDFQKMWNRRQLAVFVGKQIISVIVNDLGLLLVCVFSYTNTMSQQACIFSDDALCRDRFTTFFDLHHDECCKHCFPGATVIIEILLLCDDRFYQDRLPFCSTFICSFHKEAYLREFWLTQNNKCWLCLSQKKWWVFVSSQSQCF